MEFRIHAPCLERGVAGLGEGTCYTWVGVGVPGGGMSGHEILGLLK